MIRHFTATAFVVRGDATLLHWHKRLGQWMPPGGHIEPDELPTEAVLREVHEETGLVCEIVSTSPYLPFSYPDQLPAPYTILLEDIPGPDEPHKHIDLIYFVRPLEDATHDKVDDPTLRWVTSAELRENAPMDVAGCGVSAAVPEDVRQLALVAIDQVRARLNPEASRPSVRPEESKDPLRPAETAESKSKRFLRPMLHSRESRTTNDPASLLDPYPPTLDPIRMLNIQLLREHSDLVRRSLERRHTEAPLDEALALDNERRVLLTEVEGIRAERNTLSKEIGEMARQMKTAETKDAKHAEHRTTDLKARSIFLGQKLEDLETRLRILDEQLREVMLEIPNIVDDSAPDGADESANVVRFQSGEPPDLGFKAKPHWELGESLDIIDFERGTKLAGTRFYVLKGQGAHLQRALINWMVDFHTARGFREVYPPAMIKEENLWAGGWLPKFGENMYHDAEEDFWWIPTAEVALTNMHRDEILEAGTLPLDYVAYTPCFRREKMSAGRDVRGIKRGHQFDKVEMYRFIEPEHSADALEALAAQAEAVAAALGLTYRRLDLCTGDLGFNAARTYDIEVWSPGSQEWLEVSSCSLCTDFQARRANIRYRKEKGGKPEHPHTLNGSGLALPRTMIAVIENYQQSDGSILIPDVLRPYMMGVERITVTQ